MAFVDKTLVCSECGAEFIFTAGEQEFYRERGLRNEPSRCPSCRAARRRARLSYQGLPRQTYHAICANCGKECEVPFQPRGDRPVYCSECYAKIRERR
jgi:CxxC-x17-CxxC domain-containing protein